MGEGYKASFFGWYRVDGRGISGVQRLGRRALGFRGLGFRVYRV